MNALYDVLLTVDTETGAVQPGLATDFSTTDGLTWTMKLRSDVIFSDGTPFNAEAVRLQWERAKVNPRSSSSPYLKSAVSMTTVDDTTFQIVFDTPNRQVHQLVAWSNLVWIPSPTAVAAQGDNFGNAPVGAGPFALASRTPNSQTVVDRNPTYWQEGLPKLDQLTIRTIPDAQQAYDTVLTGSAESSVYVPDQVAAEARDAGMTVSHMDTIGGTGWLFGQKRAPFDDVRAREAVYLAVDRDAVNQVTTDGAGLVPNSLFPESSPFYDEAARFPTPDPVRAQELFDELAAQGKPVKFTITTTEGDAQTRAVALQTQFAQFDNLEVAVDVLPGASYGTTLYAGDFDLAIYGFGGTDPEPAVAQLRSTHPMPIVSMGSPEIDAAVEAGRTATDVSGRKAAYDDLQAEMNEQFRLLFTARQMIWIIETSKVAGLESYGQGSVLVTNYGLVG